MQFDQLKRREFITLRGSVAARGAGAAAGDAGDRVSQQWNARSARSRYRFGLRQTP
jgi:hypothetical protein